MSRLAEAQEAAVKALSQAPPPPDFSPLAAPLEQLNGHMAKNAEALEKLGDFRGHLDKNTEKLDGITEAINQLIEGNRKLGKVMAAIIGEKF